MRVSCRNASFELSSIVSLRFISKIQNQTFMPEISFYVPEFGKFWRLPPKTGQHINVTLDRQNLDSNDVDWLRDTADTL
jgi:hypothetical protein